MRTLLLAALVACGSPDDPDRPTTGTSPDPGTPSTGTTASGTEGGTPTGGVTQTTTWDCRADIPDEDLHGNYPPTEKLLPEFTAYNYDGTERHKPDLQGHVTVLWFYPAAMTGG